MPGLTDPLPANAEATFTVGGLTWRSLPFPGHTKGLLLYVLEPPAAGMLGDVSDQAENSRTCPLLFSGDGEAWSRGAGLVVPRPAKGMNRHQHR